MAGPEGSTTEPVAKAPDFSDPSVVDTVRTYIDSLDRSSEASILAGVHELEALGILAREEGPKAPVDDVFGGGTRLHLAGQNSELSRALVDLRIDAVNVSATEFNDRLEEVLRASKGVTDPGVALAAAVGDSAKSGEVTLRRKPVTVKHGDKSVKTTVIEPQMDGAGIGRAKNQVVIDQVRALSPTDRAAYDAEMKRTYDHITEERRATIRREQLSRQAEQAQAAELARIAEAQSVVGKARAEVERDYPQVWERYHYHRDEATTQAEKDRLDAQFDAAALKIVADREATNKAKEAAEDERIRAELLEQAREQLKEPVEVAREYVDAARPDIWERYHAERNGLKTDEQRAILDAHFNALAAEMYARRGEPIPLPGTLGGQPWANEAILRRFDGTDHQKLAENRARVEGAYVNSNPANRATYYQYKEAIGRAPNDQTREDLELRLDALMSAHEVQQRHYAYEFAHGEALREAYRGDIVARKEMDVAAHYDQLIAQTPDASHRMALQRERTAAVENTRNLYREAIKDGGSSVSKVKQGSMHRVLVTERIAGSTPANEAQAEVRHQMLQMEAQPYRVDKQGGQLHFRGKHRGPRVIESYYHSPSQPDIILVERRLGRTNSLISQTAMTTYDAGEFRRRVAQIRADDAKLK